MTKKEVVDHLEYLSAEAKRIAFDDVAIESEYQTLIADWEEFKKRFHNDPLFDEEILAELVEVEQQSDLQQVKDRTQVLNFLSVFTSIASGFKKYRNNNRKEKLMKFSTETSSAAFNIKMKNILR